MDNKTGLIIIAVVSIIIIFFVSPIIRFYINADLNSVIHYGPADEVALLEVGALLFELHGIVFMGLSLAVTTVFFQVRRSRIK